METLQRSANDIAKKVKKAALPSLRHDLLEQGLILGGCHIFTRLDAAEAIGRPVINANAISALSNAPTATAILHVYPANHPFG